MIALGIRKYHVGSKMLGNVDIEDGSGPSTDILWRGHCPTIKVAISLVTSQPRELFPRLGISTALLLLIVATPAYGVYT